jgi:ketosteroid isomerase-like protein
MDRCLMRGHERPATALQYLAAMDAGDYAAAGALFAEGAQYQRPLITAAGNAPVMEVIVGRQAILDSWEKRGKRNIVHKPTTIVDSGDHVFVEGVATVDGNVRLSFMTSVSFGRDGLFTRVTAHSAMLPASAGETGGAKPRDIPGGVVMDEGLLRAEAVLRSLANRYADGINRADFEDVGRCWAQDGVWRVPAPFNIERHGRDEIVARLAGRRAEVDIVVMLVGTVTVTEVSADRILGRTTIEEVGRLNAERGLHVFGLYDDVLVRTGGEWQFASRTLNLLAVDNSPTVYEASPAEL